MNKNMEYKAFFYVLTFFVSFYFLLSSGHFDSADEVHVFETTQSIVTKGNLTILPVIDAMPGRGGECYSCRGILSSILLIPFYLTGSFLEHVLPGNSKLLFVIGQHNKMFPGFYNSLFGGNILIYVPALFNVLVTALLCALYYLFGVKMKFSRKTSLLSAFILGTSTILCCYSKTLYTHTLGSLFLFTAAYFLITDDENIDNFLLILSGLSLGFAALTRIELAVAVPVYLWYLVVSKTSFRFKGLIYRKSSVPSDHAGGAGENKNEHGYLRDLFDFLSSLRLAKPDYAREDIVKCFIFLAPVVLALIIYCFINYLKFESFTKFGYPAYVSFTTPFLKGVYGNLFSAGRSVFIYSPPIIIAVFYFKRFFLDKKNEAALFISVSILFILLYSEYVLWHGAMCWGNRFLLVIIPFLLFPLNYLIEDYFRHKRKRLFYFMLLFVFLGVFMQILGMTPSISWVFFSNSLSLGNSSENYFLFIPGKSQIALNWRFMLKGEAIDYFLYSVYKTQTFIWTLFFTGVPLLGIILSVCGVYRMVNISTEE